MDNAEIQKAIDALNNQREYLLAGRWCGKNSPLPLPETGQEGCLLYQFQGETDLPGNNLAIRALAWAAAEAGYYEPIFDHYPNSSTNVLYWRHLIRLNDYVFESAAEPIALLEDAARILKSLDPDEGDTH